MSRPPAIDRADLLACRDEHLTAAETAERFGLSPAYVRELAHDLGIKFRDPRSVHPDVVEQMATERKAGATYQQIADTHGLTRSGARQILNARPPRQDEPTEARTHRKCTEVGCRRQEAKGRSTGLCETLAGGRWVKRRGIRVWLPNQTSTTHRGTNAA